MKTKLLIFLLFLITASSVLKAQEKEHEYIPLLDTNKVWIEAMRMEFGYFSIWDTWIGDTISHNDTLYYELYSENFGTFPRYLREDTIEQKVYFRRTFDYEEKLYYDFSLQVGDSISFYPDYYFQLDIKQKEEILGINRYVYYLRPMWDTGLPYTIWVEGVGSLAGIIRPSANPGLNGMGQTELTCCYGDNILVYQSDLANEYDCKFENAAPELYGAWIEPDTIALNKEIFLIVYAFDLPNNYIYVSAIVNAPNGETFLWNNFNFNNIEDYYYYQTKDYHQQTGDWYVSQLILEDTDNNTTIINYDSNNSSMNFHVTLPVSTNELKNENIKIYPNPVTDIVFIENYIPNTEEFFFEIFDVFGNKVFRSNLSKDKLEVDLTFLKSGLYIVKIQNQNQILLNKKLIKL